MDFEGQSNQKKPWPSGFILEGSVVSNVTIKCYSFLILEGHFVSNAGGVLALELAFTATYRKATLLMNYFQIPIQPQI